MRVRNFSLLIMLGIVGLGAWQVSFVPQLQPPLPPLRDSMLTSE